MEELRPIASSLAGLADLLNLAEPGPLCLDEPTLPAAARVLDEAVGAGCPGAAGASARVRQVVQDAVLSGSAESARELVAGLGALLDSINGPISGLDSVRAYRTCRSLAAVSDSLARTGGEELRGRLAAACWAAEAAAEWLAWAGDAVTATERTAVQDDAFGGSAGTLPALERDGAARLAGAIDSLARAVEARSRECWLEALPLASSAADAYISAWRDLFPTLCLTLNPAALAAHVGHCAAICETLEMRDIGRYARDGDFVAGYALQWLIPPDPSRFRIDSAADLERLLDSQFSRWYFGPFRPGLRPAEMVAAALRAGRPLKYKRMAAHALVQYAIVLSLPPCDAVGPIYGDLLACLERNFELLVSAWLLGEAHGRLASAQAWYAYLDGLVRLHTGGEPTERLERAKQRFLAARKLSSPAGILRKLSMRVVVVN